MMLQIWQHLPAHLSSCVWLIQSTCKKIIAGSHSLSTKPRRKVSQLKERKPADGNLHEPTDMYSPKNRERRKR